MDLYTSLCQVHPIPQEVFQMLAKNFVPRSYKKGDVLVNPGEVQRDLYFVRKGVQMSFYESDKVHVVAFTYPPNACAVPGSLTLKKPSTCSIVCLSDSEMDSIPFQVLESILDREPALQRLFLTLMEGMLAGVIDRHIELHSKSMTERFQDFCRRSPQLLRIVPHKFIASYLAIDPTNFSKMFNSVRI